MAQRVKFEADKKLDSVEELCDVVLKHAEANDEDNLIKLKSTIEAPNYLFTLQLAAMIIATKKEVNINALNLLLEVAYPDCSKILMSAIEGAASVGNTEMVKVLIKTEGISEDVPYVRAAVVSAARNRQFALIESLIEEIPPSRQGVLLVDTIMAARHIFKSDTTYVLQALASIKNNELRKRFAAEIDRQRVLPENISLYLEEVSLIAKQNPEITFNQRMAFYEVQELLTHANKYLPNILLVIVGDYIERNVFNNSIPLEIKKLNVCKNLRHFHLALNKFFKDPLSLTCANAGSEQELNRLITTEKDALKMTLAKKNPLKNNLFTRKDRTAYVKCLEEQLPKPKNTR